MRFLLALHHGPGTQAKLSGSKNHPRLWGTIRFYPTEQDVIILPEKGWLCENGIFAFHFQGGGSCTGSTDDCFADALGHYNPERCPQPNHADDTLPLFSNHGYTLQAFLTDRFTLREIIVRTVIIHESVDDFTSQPAGNAGKRIVYGVIRETVR